MGHGQPLASSCMLQVMLLATSLPQWREIKRSDLLEAVRKFFLQHGIGALEQSACFSPFCVALLLVANQQLTLSEN